MCWSMEYGTSANLPGVLKRWLDGPRTYLRVPPPPPLRRGTLTVRRVLGIDDPGCEGNPPTGLRVGAHGRAAVGDLRLWIARAILPECDGADDLERIVRTSPAG